MTNINLDRTLQNYGACFDASPEERAALLARVRAEATARYGRFDVALASKAGERAAVHTTTFAPRGIMTSLRVAMRPAFVIASLVLVVATAGTTFIRRDDAPTGSVTPSEPEVVVVVPDDVAPVLPGSGSAMSVFGGAVASTTPTMVDVRPSTAQSYQRSQQVISPAPGVFSRWGTSVFSEEELMKYPRDGKNVFSS